MPATGIAALLLLISLVLVVVAVLRRSLKIALAAAVLFGLVVVFVGLLALSIGRM